MTAWSSTPITAADLLNDRVLPMLEENGVDLIRIPTDRGAEFCGRPERHGYQLFLAVNDIAHTKTKAYSPQTNGICERFHRTGKEESNGTVMAVLPMEILLHCVITREKT